MNPDVPQPPAHLAGLDHLRALAISMVLLFHSRLFPHPPWVDQLGEFGWTGVDLFFVLSGYLISSQLFAQLARQGSLDLRSFFLKRALRILPAYFLVVAVYFSVPAFRERSELPSLWRFLTFTQNFGLDVAARGAFSHAWSLCVEEQFYLALPLALWLLVRFRALKHAWELLPALFLAGLVLRYAAWSYSVAPLPEDDQMISWHRTIYYPTWQRLDGLIAGVSLALLLTYVPAARSALRQRGFALFVAAFAVLGGAWLVAQDRESLFGSVVCFPLVSLAYGLLVASALSPSSPIARVPAWVTSQAAKLSFAIYLVHKGVIHCVQTALMARGQAPDTTFSWVLGLAASIAAAQLIRLAVERPALALKNRLLAPTALASSERNAMA